MRQRQVDPLVEFRDAVRGWAFCNSQMLQGRVAMAERLIAAVPTSHRAECEETLRHMRAVLSRPKSL